jgi:mono/diheme cytochrome c family protein
MKSVQNLRHSAATGTAVALLVGGLALAGGVLHSTTITAAGSPQAAQEPWVISPRRAAVPNPLPNTPENITAGQGIYKDECLTCHGPKGQNDGPGAKKIAEEMKVALVLTDRRVQEQTDGALFWKITDGRGKMASMAKDLSVAQRWQLVHFLRTLTP